MNKAKLLLQDKVYEKKCRNTYTFDNIQFNVKNPLIVSNAEKNIRNYKVFCILLCLISIQDIQSNFIACESFPESNSPDIFALCETNLENSTKPISIS